VGRRKAPASHTRKYRASRSVAVVALLAFALAGCTTATPKPDNSSSLSRFYDQKIHWTSCTNGLLCGKAMVPLDWAHPAGATISIAMAKKPALGTPAKGALLFDPGGPGASGVDFMKESADSIVDQDIELQYDLVGFDPRGVGHSTPVRCYDSSQLQHYYYDVLPGAIGSAQWLAADLKTQTAFAKACARNTGPLLAHVDTVSSARDMDVLRAALGDKKLDYYGVSYGTDLGLEYARLFPKKVGRFVLDSVDPPDVSGEQYDIGQAVGFETELQQYLASCLSMSGCPFTGTVNTADAQLTALFARLDAHPITNADGRILNASNLAIAIGLALYSPSIWSYLTTALRAVERGSSGPAFILGDYYFERNSNGQYPNLIETYYAVECLDKSYPDTAATMRSEAAIIDKDAPVLGPYFGYENAACGAWAYPHAAQPSPVVAKGSGPILLLSATNDPATPHAWAEEAAVHLANGHLITRVGNGHGSYNKGYPCIDTVVDLYVLRGVVPKTDPMCPSGPGG
jgi:pimeloyl-ACP methyl ester carboxylesterase